MAGVPTKILGQATLRGGRCNRRCTQQSFIRGGLTNKKIDAAMTISISEKMQKKQCLYDIHIT